MNTKLDMEVNSFNEENLVVTIFYEIGKYHKDHTISVWQTWVSLGPGLGSWQLCCDCLWMYHYIRLLTANDRSVFAAFCHLPCWCPGLHLHLGSLSLSNHGHSLLTGLCVLPLNRMYILHLFTFLVINFLTFFCHILSFTLFWLLFDYLFMWYWFCVTFNKGTRKTNVFSHGRWKFLFIIGNWNS